MRPHRAYSFHDIVLDVDRGCLRRDEDELKLRRKSFQVLCYLVERAGVLVPKEELLQAVWPDTFVTDDSLTKCLADIRRVLGAESEGIVKTVPRRGYVFDARVERSGFEDAVADNLPTQLTSVVGREAEVAEVARLLADHRLVTLTGAGGCGKTRLALETARCLTGCRDGIWITELAALSEERLVADAVGASLGLRSDTDKGMTRRVTEYLSKRSVLLVLDNCEHLIAACAVLANDILQACPHVRVLATSREPLRVAGECTVRVRSLSLPSDAAGLEEIARAEAVQLMIARIKAMRSSFALTSENCDAVARVCRRLDGIPLAIELAAARTSVLSLDQIAARLDDRFRLLVGGSRTALPRHQTLRAAIDWSYETLTDREKQLFRRLSTFAGGWTLDTASAVCGDASIDEHIVQVMSGLVDKSLVLADEDEAAGRRFRTLETVRAYSRERVVESGEDAAMADRHLACFRELVVAARRELRGPRQSMWLKRLHAEHDNLRAALAWCEAAPERLEVGLELCAGLHWFWFKHGHLAEARRWLPRMLDEALPDERRLANLTAECLFSLGLSTTLTGDPVGGGRHLEASLRLARDAGDHALVVVVLRMIVHGLVERGEVEAAESLSKEALATADRLPSSWEKAAALGSAGIVHRAKGDYATASDYFRREVEAWRQSGDDWMLAASAADAAETEVQRGHADAAHSLTLEMLDRADVRDAPTLAWNLEVFARTLAARLDVLSAARVWGAAEVVFERIGLKTPLYWRVAYEQSLQVARRALADDKAFDEAWQEGRTMNPFDAVTLALRGE